MGMLRTEVIGNATLILGDCHEVLPSLPATAAIISDPPYGIAFEHGGFAKVGSKTTAKIARESQFSKVSGGGHRLVGDDQPFDPNPLFRFDRVALWGANHYAHRLPIVPGSGWLFWDKVPIAGYEGRWSFSDGELCWFNRPFALRIIRHYWNGALRPDGEEKGKPRAHPTQKPVRVMQRCVELAKLSPSAMVIDPYMGSGTTLLAALRAGHPCIGIEVDSRYFESACQRVEAEQRQQRMFV